jgi:hypothetical protein
MSDNSFGGINFDDPQSKSIFKYHAEMMCPRYKTVNESGFVEGIKVTKNNFVYYIEGEVTMLSMKNVYIKYSACNPPTYNGSFTGSGLPFPSEDVAYENSPNRGVVEVVNGRFKFTIKYPNSYYINLGTVYVPPHVKIMLVDCNNEPLSEPQVIDLGEGIPFRTLTWPKERDWNKGSLFYDNKNLTVRTQYEILLDSAYPLQNTMPRNFWGTKPPV